MSSRFCTSFAVAIILCSCVSAAKSPSGEMQRVARELIDQGTALLRQGRLDEAAAAYTISLEVYPGATAVDGLGCVAFARNDMELAEKLYLRSLAFDPWYVDAARNLAAVYEHTNRAQSARELYQRVLNADPRDARARNNLSAALSDSGDVQGAREQILGAAVVADHPIIRDNLKTLDSIENIHYSEAH